jgi:hypothetical protein
MIDATIPSIRLRAVSLGRQDVLVLVLSHRAVPGHPGQDRMTAVGDHTWRAEAFFKSLYDMAAQLCRLSRSHSAAPQKYWRMVPAWESGMDLSSLLDASRVELIADSFD